MLRDLEFIYQQIIENHPGIYNKEDPNFTQFLEEQYFLYRPLIHQAQSIEEQKCLLDRFTKSFDDGHLGIEWNEKNKRKIAKTCRLFYSAFNAYDCMGSDSNL